MITPTIDFDERAASRIEALLRSEGRREPKHVRAETLNRAFISIGAYSCFMCGKTYLANAPHTWDRCTPDYCHECCAMPEPI